MPVSLRVPVGGPGGGRSEVGGVEGFGPVVDELRRSIQVLNGQAVALDDLAGAITAGLVEPFKILGRHHIRVQQELLVRRKAVGESGVEIIVEVQPRSLVIGEGEALIGGPLGQLVQPVRDGGDGCLAFEIVVGVVILPVALGVQLAGDVLLTLLVVALDGDLQNFSAEFAVEGFRHGLSRADGPERERITGVLTGTGELFQQGLERIGQLLLGHCAIKKAIDDGVGLCVHFLLDPGHGAPCQSNVAVILFPRRGLIFEADCMRTHFAHINCGGIPNLNLVRDVLEGEFSIPDIFLPGKWIVDNPFHLLIPPKVS